MKAVVTTPFPGAKDGDIYPTYFKVGDIIEGDLARVAIEAKLAVEGEELPAEAGPVPAPIEIPANWSDMLAAETVALARALGADESVKTKTAAVAVIEAEIARREAAAATDPAEPAAAV
ncbi:hypothetical protein [Nitrobacter sp.]|uniref:hypothetical protein n=1 Tax=Nitrobacter sp. TaxID=29420 RepID=UPI0029CAB100|nr:hypothetical protein [Nitrobacter sp.]